MRDLRAGFRPSGRLASLLSVLLAAALGLLGAPRQAGADDVEIARGGKALACIILSPTAAPMEKEAAEDLRWAVTQATDAKLEVLSALPAEDHRIPIRINSGTQPEGKDFPYDGGVVLAQPDGITITGPTPAGVANAVATILLEDIGVRTYYPDPQFTIVPRAKSIKIRSRTVKPKFDYRLWSGVTGRDAAAYIRRNRLTDGRVSIPHWGFGHNLATIISVSACGKEHPEYFAFREKGRLVHGKDVGDTSQPCFSNPEVLRLSIEAARKFFNQNPQRDTFSLCVNDNSRYCECEKCAALDKPYRDLPVGRQYSESYYDYVSKVAEAVQQSHPGRFVGVYAYWNVEQPPRNRQRLPDNVIVALTLDILQHYDPAYRDKDQALVKAWAGFAKHLHTYVYYGLGWLTPRTSPHLVAEDLRFAAQSGVRAVYCEAYPFWAWSGAMDYVAARLQWDPSEDLDKLLDEFHRDCFGEVAPQMRAFHDACERYWTRQRPGRWFEGLDGLAPEAAMADVALLNEAEKHLAAAQAEVKSPLVRQRMVWLRKGFTLTVAVGKAFEIAKSAGPDKLERLVSAAGAVERAYDLVARDPAYANVYYVQGDRFSGKCWGWFREPIRAAAEARWKQLHATLPAAEADAQWKTLESDSGLASLLTKRKWKFGFTQPSR